MLPASGHPWTRGGARGVDRCRPPARL